MKRFIGIIMCVFIAGLMGFMMSPVRAEEVKEIKLGILPVYSYMEVFNRAKGLRQYLEKEIGIKVNLVFTKDIDDYLRQAQLDALALERERQRGRMEERGVTETGAMERTQVQTGAQIKRWEIEDASKKATADAEALRVQALGAQFGFKPEELSNARTTEDLRLVVTLKKLKEGDDTGLKAAMDIMGLQPESPEAKLLEDVSPENRVAYVTSWQKAQKDKQGETKLAETKAKLKSWWPQDGIMIDMIKDEAAALKYMADKEEMQPEEWQAKTAAPGSTGGREATVEEIEAALDRHRNDPDPVAAAQADLQAQGLTWIK